MRILFGRIAWQLFTEEVEPGIFNVGIGNKKGSLLVQTSTVINLLTVKDLITIRDNLDKIIRENLDGSN